MVEEFEVEWIKSLGIDFLDLIKRFEETNKNKQFYNDRLKEYLKILKPEEMALLLMMYYEESKECSNNVYVLKEILEKKIEEE